MVLTRIDTLSDEIDLLVNENEELKTSTFLWRIPITTLICEIYDKEVKPCNITIFNIVETLIFNKKTPT